MFSEFLEAARMRNIGPALTPLQVLGRLFPEVVQPYANKHELFQEATTPTTPSRTIGAMSQTQRTLSSVLSRQHRCPTTTCWAEGSSSLSRPRFALTRLAGRTCFFARSIQLCRWPERNFAS